MVETESTELPSTSVCHHKTLPNVRLPSYTEQAEALRKARTQITASLCTTLLFWISSPTTNIRGIQRWNMTRCACKYLLLYICIQKCKKFKDDPKFDLAFMGGQYMTFVEKIYHEYLASNKFGNAVNHNKIKTIHGSNMYQFLLLPKCEFCINMLYL